MNSLVDRKSWWSVFLLTLVNHLALFFRFRKIEISGRANLPKGACIVIANHSSRWDSLIIQKMLSRPANYMTSPKELCGLQGALIPGIGSFPARASRDVIKFIAQQAKKNEPLVIFPEGTVYYDGITHPFKTGTARIALSLNEMGINVPIVPVAIAYDKNDLRQAQVLIGQPVQVEGYAEHFRTEPAKASKTLTSSLHREICYLKLEQGDCADKETLFIGNSHRSWAPLLCSLPSDVCKI